MNNKGQVLILFVLLLPIVFVAVVFLFNVSYQYYQKQKITNEVREAINFYFSSDQYVANIRAIEHRLQDHDLMIKHSDDEIIIEISYQTNILGRAETVDVIYVGQYKNNQVFVREGL